jgi:hypothetical protein
MATAGQPTKYRKKYCEVALDYVGEQGKSIVQLAKHLKVSRQTIYQWANDNPEFSDTLTCAKDWAEAIWEDRYLDMMTSRESNPQLVKLYFANRFKWHERPESDGSEDKAQPMNIQFSVSPPVTEVKVTNAKSE